MKKPVSAESASAFIDAKIDQLADWRGKTLAKVRQLIHQADPEIVEESKWRGTPVWSQGASLPDPAGLFNSSLEGNVRRAIDVHEGEKINETALKNLIRAAVALNLKAKSKPKAR
jgi:hypothetical protein